MTPISNDLLKVEPSDEPESQPQELQLKEGKLEARSVIVFNQFMKSAAVVALVSGVSSLSLCCTENSKSHSSPLSYCLGSCYVITEICLVVGLISYIAFQVFLKLR